MSGIRTVPCKGCGRPIIFVTTENGKKMPLDPRPRVYSVEYDAKGEPVGVAPKPPTTWVTHFATCPAANEFSGGAKHEQGEG